MKTTTKIKRKLTKLEEYLQKQKVKFSRLEHKIVFTAHDAAQTQKKKLGEIAKVVLVRVDRSLALVVVPAGKYVDFKSIQKAVKAKKIAMATEKDITKFLKTKVGLLHPFGNLYKIPTLLDRGLARSKKMIASAGSYTDSIEVAVKDFEKLVQPIKGVFSKSKR